MWCDWFDADLLKVVPGAAEALGPAGAVRLQTYSWLTGGTINGPSAWNTSYGLVAFFWAGPKFQPDACYSTSAPVSECTFLEAVRDEWVHLCAVGVHGHVVWWPPARLMEKLMCDVRGETVLAGGERKAVQQEVLRSLRHAAERLTETLALQGSSDGRR